MGVRKSEVLHITLEKGTVGGVTYWVEHPDWKGQERALCYRKMKFAGKGDHPLDSHCSRKAGWGTSHVGEGSCKYHGGNISGTGNMTNGRAAKGTRSQLKDRIDDYIETGDRQGMLDLSFELGSLKVLFQELIEYFPEPDDKNYTLQVTRAVGMIQATGSLVDKISKIQSRNNITTAQVMYLRVVMADILARHISDPDDRERAISDLMARIRGGEGDQELRMIAM